MSLKLSRQVLLTVALGLSLFTPRTSEAGPFLDWLFGRRPVYYPVGTPTPVTGVAAAACPGPISVTPGSGVQSAGYAPIPATTGGRAWPAAPVAVAPYFAPIRSAYASQSLLPQLQPYTAQQPVLQPNLKTFGANAYVPGYVSAPLYQSAAFPVPVTAYRPVTTVDPTTGQQHVTLQPCTTYEWQARRVPYNAYRPIRGLFGSTHYDVPPQALGQQTYLPALTAGATGGALPALGAGNYLSGTIIPGMLDGGQIGSPVAPNAISSPDAYGTYPSQPGFGDAAGSGPSSSVPRILPSEESPGSGIPRTQSPEPADLRPSLKDVPVEIEGASPSVSIRNGSGRFSAPIQVEAPEIKVPSPSHTQLFRSEPVDAGNGAMTWRNSSTHEGDSAKRRTNAKPIPDPDRGSSEFRSLTPPRLLEADDRSVRLPSSRTSPIAPASWTVEAPVKSVGDVPVSPNASDKPNVPTKTSVPVKTDESRQRRNVIHDSDWKSNGR